MTPMTDHDKYNPIRRQKGREKDKIQSIMVCFSIQAG